MPLPRDVEATLPTADTRPSETVRFTKLIGQHGETHTEGTWYDSQAQIRWRTQMPSWIPPLVLLIVGVSYFTSLLVVALTASFTSDDARRAATLGVLNILAPCGLLVAVVQIVVTTRL